MANQNKLECLSLAIFSGYSNICGKYSSLSIEVGITDGRQNKLECFLLQILFMLVEYLRERPVAYP